MRFKALLTVNAALAAAFGLALLLQTTAMLRMYGITLVPPSGSTNPVAMLFWTASSFVRLFGAVSIGAGILLWSLRGIGDSAMQGITARALLIGNALAFLISFSQWLSVWNTPTGLATVIVFLAFAVAYAPLSRLTGRRTGDTAVS